MHRIKDGPVYEPAPDAPPITYSQPRDLGDFLLPPPPPRSLEAGDQLTLKSIFARLGLPFSALAKAARKRKAGN